MTLQKKATIVATITAGNLAVIKLVFGIMSGSVAILASAIDSVLDLVISLFNYFAVNTAEKNPNEKFNYGFGKIEALAGVFEGSLIGFSGLYILYQAFSNYTTGTEIVNLESSIIVMIISMVVTFCLVWFLNYVYKKTGSLVIKSDSLHYKTDLLTNASVLVSLGLVYLTSLNIIDSLVGGAIAIYIVYSAIGIIKESVFVLMDKSIDDEMIAQIEEIIKSKNRVSSFHCLKTRSAGNNIFVDVHVVFDKEILLYDAHKVGDKIEDEIAKLDNSKEWVINIHLDPVDDFKDFNH
ncbi:MAG: cation transporter [Campylobacterales bacterium]|nr:cation transporter [Campylobacterales bacterium]